MLRHVLEDLDMSKITVTLRTEHNMDRDLNSVLSGLKCEDPSRTVQSQADEADINTIVRNFGITGKLPEGVRVPTYGDFEFVGDYKDALAAIQEADKSFFAMPAEVRSRFDNDPARFVDFCSDPSNLDEMRKLGLAVPAAAPPPVPTPEA